MRTKQNKYFSRRSFLATGAMACASGLALKGYGSTGANSGPETSYGKTGGSPGPNLMRKLAHGYIPDKRTHPAEGLTRENIVITDIQVTPLPYVTPKDNYLWRVGGLVVWKSDAALVQIFTNKGIIGIGEGSPYCEPDKIKKYTDTEVYQNKYPELKNIREHIDVNTIKDNLLVDCKSKFLRDNGKQVKENNMSIQSEGKNIDYFCSDDVLKQYGLQPIPLQEIGPQNNRWVD